jgi:hypothetical protein
MADDGGPTGPASQRLSGLLSCAKRTLDQERSDYLCYNTRSGILMVKVLWKLSF